MSGDVRHHELAVALSGMRPRVMRWIAAFIAGLALLGATDAQAQFSAGGTADRPPDTSAVSPGGVDMVTGRYRSASTDLSIGTPETGGITYQRMEISRGNNYIRGHNWYIAIFIKIYNPQLQNWAVSYNGTAKNFELGTAPYFTPVGFYDQGETRLEVVDSSTEKFTDNDGTVIYFANGGQNQLLFATKMVRPNGITYDFQYDNGSPKRLRRVVSSSGYQLILEYSAAGVSKACVFNAAQTPSPSSQTCPAGVQTANYGYDAAGLLSSFTAPDSSTSSVVTSAPANGSYTESFYKPGYAQPVLVNQYQTTPDAWGYVVGAQTYGDGRTIAYDYANLNDFIIDNVNPSGTARGAGWLDNGQARTTLTWASRRSLIHPNNPGPLFISPGPERITDPLNRDTYNFYDGATPDGPYSYLMSKDRPSGRYESFSYDQFRLLSRTDHAAGTALPNRQITLTYGSCTLGPGCALPTSVTDALNNVTNYSYDPVHGGILSETWPAAPNGIRPQKRYAYSQHSDYSGNLVWLLDAIRECATQSSCPGTADERVISFAYDGQLRVTSSTTASGDGVFSQTTAWSYDASGNKLTEDGPTPGPGDTTRWRYDVMRRIVGIVTPDPDGSGPLPPLATRNSYDAAGRLIRVEKGNVADQSDAAWSAFSATSSIELSYDIMDRKTSETTVANGAFYALTQYTYDAFGRLECSAVRMNPAAYGSLPASACTLGQTGAQGPDRITRNYYDLAGQLVQVRKAVGTPLELADATYGYDRNGDRTALIDANGNKATMAYDGYDRLAAWYFPDKVTIGAVSASDHEAYGYDANDRRTSLRKRDGRTIGYAYDALGRMTLKDIPDGTASDVYYGYDLLGLQAYARFGSPSGPGITNTYDTFGLLRTATTNQGGVVRTVTTKHDEHGNLRRIVYPDGVTFVPVSDGLDRPSGVIDDDLTSLVGIAYDAQGRRASMTRGGLTTSYGYDPVSRPTSIADDLAGTAGDVTTGYGYNPAGQITTKTRSNGDYAFTYDFTVSRPYVTNGLNQYVSAGQTGFDFDPNGNLTVSGTTTYGYDVENRLTSSSTGTLLEYDPLGRLYRVSSPQVGTRAASDTRFLYDGDQLVAEYDADGAVMKRYVHGPGEDDPLLWYEGAGLNDKRTLQSDAQGSIVSVANAGGLLLGINAYDEYGIPGGGNLGRFQYTGQAWIPELGLYYYKARFYSPTLGRFMQTDPIGYADQNNLYAYVGNDPVNGRDPKGLYECKKQDCEGAKHFVGQIHNYMKKLKDIKNPSKQEANTIKKVEALSVFLGSENDGNDVIIFNNSSMDSDTPGSASLGSNGVVSINLDYGRLYRTEKSGGGPGGAVLLHEAAHGYEYKYQGQISSYDDRLRREKNAYRIGMGMERSFGIYDSRSVNEAAAQSCDTAMSRDYGQNGTVTQSGHCR